MYVHRFPLPALEYAISFGRGPSAIVAPPDFTIGPVASDVYIHLSVSRFASCHRVFGFRKIQSHHKLTDTQLFFLYIYFFNLKIVSVKFFVTDKSYESVLYFCYVCYFHKKKPYYIAVLELQTVNLMRSPTIIKKFDVHF